MAWPTITINQLNQMQGDTADVERHFLFVGKGTKGVDTLISVNTQTDFDAVLGEINSDLKANLQAAMLNAGQNWTAAAYVIASDGDWADAVRIANETQSFEMVVLCDPIADDAQSEITKAQALKAELIAQYGRFVRFQIAVVGIDSATQAWADYEAKLVALQDGIAADGVGLVPSIWPNAVGIYAGRLCTRAASIADSPCRTKTGALVSEDLTLPKDMNDVTLTTATLQTLEANRFSVPMWWPDYDGIYWSDGRMLDVEGGDYQVIEYCRVIDKVSRKMRIRAIARIGDRSFNSTPYSMAAATKYFLADMRAMSKSTLFNGEMFPGEIMPPSDDDFAITWVSKTSVKLYAAVTPYDCPKTIEINLMLDLSTDA